MKKLVLFLSLAMLLTACAAAVDTPAVPPAQDERPAGAEDVPPQPAAGADALTEVRAAAKAAGCLCAVAYAGFDFDTLAEDFDAADVIAAYPCTAETRYVDAGGDDVFVIIPADPDASLTVVRAELNGDGALVPSGAPLYDGGGEPVVLRCNVSDILPNTLVTVTGSAGGTLSSSPSVSLRDGRVRMEGAYDFTAYPEGMESD